MDACVFYPNTNHNSASWLVAKQNVKKIKIKVCGQTCLKKKTVGKKALILTAHSYLLHMSMLAYVKETQFS
jgi:hypothetical protein